MATSEARIQANQRNAQKSTGPRTPEGKERSRRNSLKHGMTGEGIVLPTEDQAEVDRRFAALEIELDPSSEVAAILVQRIATLSVRMERCVKEEAARLSEKIRKAPSDFDDRRMAEVEKLFDWIAAEPSTNSRRLKRTPEGVDRLIKGWRDMLEELEFHDLKSWGYGQWQRIENMQGRRPEDYPTSREGALCKAIWNDISSLEPGEVEGLGEKERREWARSRLRERLQAEIAELETLRAKFDMEALAKDRAESAARAMFDASKDAVLARKYEAAAERGFYRALKELRQVEAEAREAETVDPEDESAPLDDELGSSFSDSPDESEWQSPLDKLRAEEASPTSKKGRNRPS